MDYFNPLDSMCEVVMEESPEDEPIIPPSGPGNFDLPPIPTFDLQSEQFTYLPAPTPVLIPPPPLVLGRLNRTEIAECKTPQIDPSVKRFVTIAPRPIESVVVDKNDSLQFLERLFSAEFSRRVFSSPDSYPNLLSTPSIDEMKFYSERFSDASKVEYCRLHCTTCDKHLGSASSAINNVKSHKMLSVLVCKSCYDFYGDGEFPKDESDDTEIYCRWCGQGGDLVCCSFCPRVFCNKCVRRNFSGTYLKDIQDVSDWACFVCSQTPLWPLRAICRALLFYLKNSASIFDKSTCCVKEKKNRSRRNHPVKDVVKPGPVQNPMVVFHTGLMNLPPTPKVDPIIRTTRSVQQARPSIQAAKSAGVKPSQPAAPSPSIPLEPSRALQPIVKMAAREVPSQMPDVFIDHSKQDYMVVRMKIPSSKDQYLKVNVIGSCMRVPPLPSNPNFTIRSLKHAFRTNRMANNRLVNIAKKAENKSIDQADALLATLEKWKRAIGFIEEDLKHNLNVYKKNQVQNDENIIDLGDESRENMRWNFENKIQDVFEDDSDVEIIDCDDVMPAKSTPAAHCKRKMDNGVQGEPTAKKICASGKDESDSGKEKEISNTTPTKLVMKSADTVKNTKESEKNDSTLEEETSRLNPTQMEEDEYLTETGSDTEKENNSAMNCIDIESPKGDKAVSSQGDEQNTHINFNSKRSKENIEDAGIATAIKESCDEVEKPIVEAERKNDSCTGKEDSANGSLEMVCSNAEENIDSPNVLQEKKDELQAEETTTLDKDKLNELPVIFDLKVCEEEVDKRVKEVTTEIKESKVNKTVTETVGQSITSSAEDTDLLKLLNGELDILEKESREQALLEQIVGE